MSLSAGGSVKRVGHVGLCLFFQPAQSYAPAQSVDGEQYKQNGEHDAQPAHASEGDGGNLFGNRLGRSYYRSLSVTVGPSTQQLVVGCG